MSITDTLLNCPTCCAQTPWIDNIYRPFCSKRCYILDLGSWASDKFVVREDINERE